MKELTCIEDILFGNEESKRRVEDIVSGAMPMPVVGTSGILLYGIWGTGKTTLAKMLPEAIELSKSKQQLSIDYEFIQCKQGVTGPQLLNLIGCVMDKVSFNASGFHYFVLDEVDNLSADAQKSLSGKLDSDRAIFILTTNFANRVDRGLIDRCEKIEMNALNKAQELALIESIAIEHGVQVNEGQAELIAREACGSVRQIYRSSMHLVNRAKSEVLLGGGLL